MCRRRYHRATVSVKMRTTWPSSLPSNAGQRPPVGLVGPLLREGQQVLLHHLVRAVSSGCRREYTGPADAGCVRAAASTKEDVGQRLTEVACSSVFASPLLVPAHLRFVVFALLQAGGDGGDQAAAVAALG